MDNERRFIIFAGTDPILMPRPIRSRTLTAPPKMTGFKPFGLHASGKYAVRLQFDEYASFNLINYENLSQEQASEKMHISRPTFTRIYNRALKKISRAFVEGKSIEIAGGHVVFQKQWYKCRKCFKLIEGLENHVKCENCNLYGKSELVEINP